MPYATLPGADLTPEVHESLDDPPVHYVRWRGTVPGFDGMPFSVDVTIPCDAARRSPLVVMAHGFTDDKTVWQETGKGDRVESRDRPQGNSRWNNIWFASRGYTVVNYTARGWRDSCGPDTPGSTRAAPAPQCLPYEYWIHLDDKRWEVRDAQWLAGALVQSGHADPRRMAITGGSYGGGPPSMGGLLGGRTMCGASPVPEELGVDPCAGRANGELVPWTTPDGTQRLIWAAALPLYTFGDLIQVLAPNGRGSDGWSEAPSDGDHTKPFGVPMQSTVAGLLAAGHATGFFAPPGVDPDADIVTDTARLLAGNPFAQQDPLVARGTRLYREFKSPITTRPDPSQRVPLFWVHGFTDPLFPSLEPLTVMNEVLATDGGYPFKLFFGDIGHDYTGQRADEWSLVITQMNDFIDHYLRPDRTPTAPGFDVGATVTRCLDHDAAMRYVAADDWHALHPATARFSSDDAGVTSTETPGPAGLATDPILTATLPLPIAYKGCRIMSPSQADPTVVTYEWVVERDMVLMGGPVVDIAFTTTAPDVPLSTRLWHVTADGSRQGLVTRGTYRVAEGPGAASASYQLAPQGYRFPRGDRIKLEVTANDMPYLQASNIPATVAVEGVDLSLPLLEEPADPDATPSAEGQAFPQQLPATGDRERLPVALAVAAIALALRVAGRSDGFFCRWRKQPSPPHQEARDQRAPAAR